MVRTMSTLKDAHQQFIEHLRGKSRASATILAYGKDIEQLVAYLEGLGKPEAEQVNIEDLKAFMEKLSKESYTAKSISRKTTPCFDSVFSMLLYTTSDSY